jgi:hypothetical protein
MPVVWHQRERQPWKISRGIKKLGKLESASSSVSQVEGVSLLFQRELYESEKKSRHNADRNDMVVRM